MPAEVVGIDRKGFVALTLHAREKSLIVPARELMQASRKYRDSAAEAEPALANLAKAGDGKWVTDDHNGDRGQPAAVFQLLSGGNGNENTETPEENRFPLPLPGETPARAQRIRGKRNHRGDGPNDDWATTTTQTCMVVIFRPETNGQIGRSIKGPGEG